MKHKEYTAGVLTGVLVVTLAVGGVKFVQQRQYNGVLSDTSHVQKIEYLEKLIDQEYLGEVDNDEMAEGVYAGLVYGLGDVYSRYYTADEYAQETASTDGAYAGIGVSIQKNKNGGVQIAECYEGGPGAEAGLQTGDVITAINDTDVTDMELSDVVSMIRENKDKTVVLTVLRENEDSSREISVDVTDVELPSVSGEMIDESTGYIQITQFTGVTPQQYKDTFAELKDKGMERLVIDLRDNPGGLLTSVCDILREILPEGLIVYTEDKNGKKTKMKSDEEHQFTKPLAVLVNGNSASASEIYSGAIQDYGIGKIVGTQTYGKGVVQQIFDLDDGTAVKLTIAEYFTPKGRSINGKGITPDVKVEYENNEENPDADNQLDKAVEEVKAQMK